MTGARIDGRAHTAEGRSSSDSALGKGIALEVAEVSEDGKQIRLFFGANKPSILWYETEGYSFS